MIIEKQALNLCEVKGVLEKIEETPKSKEFKGFVKRFSKIKPDKAKELKAEIEGLELLKLKPEHTAKIIDLMPEDASDINKIFTDVSLDANETEKILKVVKK